MDRSEVVPSVELKPGDRIVVVETERGREARLASPGEWATHRVLEVKVKAGEIPTVVADCLDDLPRLAHEGRWRAIVDQHRDNPDALADLLASVYQAGVRAERERLRREDEERWASANGIVVQRGYRLANPTTDEGVRHMVPMGEDDA